MQLPFTLNEFIIGAIVILIVIAAVFVIPILLLRRRQFEKALARGHEMVVLLMRVPKERLGAESGPMDDAAADAQIALAESFFAIIGGMKAKKGIKTSVAGRDDHFSFEIVSSKGLISFYIVVPRAMQAFFEEQVHAQFPSAQLEAVEDYNAFTATGLVLGTELTLIRPSAFPIRTYRKQDSDPLSALTGALSRLSADESGVIQFVTRSAHPRWHSHSSAIVQRIRKGEKLTQVTGGKSALTQTASVLGASFQKPKDPSLREEPILTQRDQELMTALDEKNGKAGLEVCIRLVVTSKGEVNAKARLQSLVDAFTQYRHYEYGNGFQSAGFHKDVQFMRQFIYRTFNDRRHAILNAEEMASLFHPPLPSTETPNINWLLARKLPAPVNLPSQGIILGENIYRGEQRTVRIAPEDRRRHMYAIGTTGTGKSALFANMALQDIAAGEGVAVVDPHGSLVEQILENIPPERADDVIYFDPSDTERPIGLNMLEADTPEEADFAVQEMIAIFYKLVTDPSMIGPMFEHNMRNAMLTLMANREFPGTIAEIPRIFTDTAFQKYAVGQVNDPVVRSFWEKEMAKTSDYHKSEMLGYLISKVGRFVENAMMRNIIGQPNSGFRIRDIMDKQKILLVNLSKGKIGEINSNLLGLILVSKIQIAALSRADMRETERKDFYLYIDEFQNFITDSIAIILSEARKYKLNLALAHQYIGQLVVNNDTRVRDAIFGNVGTIVSFRVGVDDAETLAQQFAPSVSEYDLINLERFHAYVRLLIDNSASKPFTLKTLAPATGNPAIAQQIKAASRLKYGRPRTEVEQEILERSRLGAAAAAPQGAENQPRM